MSDERTTLERDLCVFFWADTEHEYAREIMERRIDDLRTEIDAAERRIGETARAADNEIAKLEAALAAVAKSAEARSVERDELRAEVERLRAFEFVAEKRSGKAPCSADCCREFKRAFIRAERAEANAEFYKQETLSAQADAGDMRAALATAEARVAELERPSPADPTTVQPLLGRALRKIPAIYRALSGVYKPPLHPERLPKGGRVKR